MFVAALSTTAKKWRQPKSPSMAEQISKTGSVHPMECYLGLKRNGILTQPMVCMALEDMVLKEISSHKQ